MSVFAGEIVGVLAHVERADENGAGPLQSLDQRGVARRFGVVAVDPRASDGRDAFDIEQVLDRERHAGKRADIASLAAGSVDCRGPGKGALDGNRCKGVELRMLLILASAAYVTASALRSPLATASAISEALAQLISAIMC